MENSLATIGGFCCGSSFVVDHQVLISPFCLGYLHVKYLYVKYVEIVPCCSVWYCLLSYYLIWYLNLYRFAGICFIPLVIYFLHLVL